MKQLVFEAVGTFGLVFLGTGSIMLNEILGGALGNLGIATVFGVAVFLMIIAFGKRSGAHFNPAVTIALLLAGRVNVHTAVKYVAAQIIGATCASSVLLFSVGSIAQLGSTMPTGGLQESLAIEILFTGILAFAVLTVPRFFRFNLNAIALVIGGVVFVAAFLGGPISGASLNPARSIGPALVSGELRFLWVYILAPIMGAIAAVIVCGKVCTEDCCTNFLTQ